MTRDDIWTYVMAIRENLKVQLEPPQDNLREIVAEQRAIVVKTEKEFLKEIPDNNDFEVLVQSSINCAFGEYEFEDLIFLYETLKAKHAAN